jgi:SAM-dependent methyltransferase
MLKYYLTAAILKTASLNGATKSLYRNIGNTVGQRGRQNKPIPPYYLKRVNRNVTLCREHDIFIGSAQVLEFGTGWMHWEALTTRLFFDFSATLYDVWDNRQMEALQSYLKQLKQALADGQISPPGDIKRALRIIDEIHPIKTFEELYKFLGFKYAVDPKGELDLLPDATFDVVISAGVLEHVHVDAAWKIVQGMARVLKPGGFGIHSITISDHLYHYDLSASPKQYLHYSERTWKLFFENEVQYINRIQRSRWLAIFERAGFDVIEDGGAFCPLNGLALNDAYRTFNQQDLECTHLELLLRKR